MTLLGVVLAGGQSTRFGRDKACALYAGKALLDHAKDSLAPHVDCLVVVGRDWPGLLRVEDLPRPGLGPLGGLYGALSWGAAQGYDAVLSCGCDTLGLTAAHIGALTPGPAVLDALPIIGLWPTRFAPVLGDWLALNARHSVYAFAQAAGARRAVVPDPPRNINQPDDLLTPPA